MTININNPIDLTNPGPIGGTTPSSGFFTTIASSSILTSTNVSIGSTSIPPDSLFTINANTAATSSPASGTIAHLIGPNASSAGFLFDAFASAGFFSARRANGVSTGLTALASGDNMFSLATIGYDGSAYSPAVTAIFSKAAENYDSSHHGSFISFETVPLASITRAEAVRINPSGGFSVGTTADYGIGTIGALNTIAATSATTSPTAGGAIAFKIGSFLNICGGSGVPTMGAQVGSLYLRTDGSAITSRAYIATSTASSSGSWASLTASS